MPAPVEAANTGATLDEGATIVITSPELDFDDSEQPDSEIVYTIDVLPIYGVLSLDGTPLGPGDSFTQLDLDNGLLTYAHDGSEASGDALYFSVSDGVDAPVTDQIFQFLIAPINDAPQMDLDFLDVTAPGNDAALAWSAGYGATAIAPFAVLFDDNLGYNGATITAAFTANGTSDDQLGVFGAGDMASGLFVDGSDLYYDGVLVGGISGGTNGSDLVVAFNAAACSCAVQLTLEGLTFDNVAAVPDTADRTVTVTLVDGGGTANGGADTASANVTITVIEAPADLDVTANGLEDDFFTSVTLVVYDSDGVNPASFMLSSLPGNGALADIFGGVIDIGVPYQADSYDGALGAWTLTLFFTPDPDWSGQTSFDYLAIDSDGNTTDGATATIDLAPVADAPIVNSGVNQPPALIGAIENVTATSATTELAPVTIGLASGDSLVLWQSGQTGSHIRAQYYDGSGLADGSTFAVTPSGAPSEAQPSAAANANGGFAIAWVQNTGGSGDVVAAFYADGATSPTATVTVSGNAGLRETDATVTAVGDGYVVSWATEDSGTAEIHAQRYDGAGAPVGAAFTVVAGADGGSFTGTFFDPPDHRVLAVGDDGAFVVVTEQGDDLVLQFVEADNDLFGLAVVNTPAVDTRADLASIAATPDGGFVIVWHQEDLSTGEESIHARAYDASGTPGAELDLTGDGRAETDPELAVLADGRIVVAWLGNNGLDNTRDVFIQTFNADGSAASQAINLSQTGGTDQEAGLSLSLDANGMVSVAWRGDGGGGRFDIYHALLDPGITSVEGEPGTIVLLPTTAALVDQDGSESLQSVVIANLPDDFAFQAGARDSLDPSIWVIDRSDPDGEAFLDNFVGYGPLQLGVPADYQGAFTLEITVTTVEADDAAQTASTTVYVPVDISPPVNQAPELDLDPFEPGNDAALYWSEGDGPRELAYYAGFVDDNASYDGATVTAAFTANGTTDDQLTILGTGDMVFGLFVDGNDIYYDGTLVGSFSGGDDGNPLVATFNAAACHCAVQLTIGSIAFDNSSATPDTSDRTVTITLVDGGGTANGGADTASAEVVVHVAAGNDAPTVVITPPDLIGNGGETDIIPAYNIENAQSKPAIATLADGSYVVVYHSVADLLDESGLGVYARHFEADGTPIGSQFKVNAFVSGDQGGATIAALDDGGFVIAWMSNGQDGSGYGIYAQRYDSDGLAYGGEFRVNATTADEQRVPEVAGLEGGGFVVVWEDRATGTFQIKAQLYDASGSPMGGAFQINDTSRGDVPQVVALADGGFAVAWQTGEGSASTEAYVRQFDADGDAVAGSNLVSTTSGSPEGRVGIATLTDGGYVVTWQSSGPDGSGFGVFAQRYTAGGAAVGTPLFVNSVTTGDQLEPVAIGLADGGFVVAWYGPDGDGYGIFAQRFDSANDPVGDQFRINDSNANTDAFPALAALADGGLLVAWQHNFDGTSDEFGNFDVVVERFDAVFAATEDVAIDLKGTILLGDVDDTGGTISVLLEVDYGRLAVDPGTSGVIVDDSDPRQILLTGTLAEIQALLGSDPDSTVTYVTEDDSPPDTAELLIAIDDGIDTSTDTATIAITAVNDPPDLDLDYLSPGDDTSVVYAAGDPPVYLAYDATIYDDNSSWDGASLTVTIAGATAGDQLSIEATGDPTFGLWIDGNDIYYDGDLVGTFTGGDDGNPLTVTFNELACGCAVEEVTYGILYENSGAVTGFSSRAVTFLYDDGQGGSDSAISTLTISPPIDAPQIDEGDPIEGNEDGAIAVTGFSVSDASVDPATGLMTVYLSVEHGTLTIRTDVAGGIDASDITGGANGSHGLVVTATPDAINATLLAANGLTYHGDADFNGNDALHMDVFDGDASVPVVVSYLPPPLSLPVEPGALAMFDIDGDGLDELFVGFGDETGGFALILPFTGVPLIAGPNAVAIHDVDGDGYDDFVYVASDSSYGTGIVSIFNGSDTVIGEVDNATGLALADFNGDGYIDVATLDPVAGQAAVILQDSDNPGAFLAPQLLDVAPSDGVVALGTGDFDGDGFADLAVATGAGTIALLLGQGDGGFDAAVVAADTDDPITAMQVADVDGDGVDDIIVSSGGGISGFAGVKVILGNGDGSFRAPHAYVTGNGDALPRGLMLGDINNDGRVDILVANGDDPGTVSILANLGDGSFGAPVVLETVGGDPHMIALGDPDGDGDLDLVVATFDGSDWLMEAFNNDTWHRGTGQLFGITVNAVNDAPVLSGQAASVSKVPFGAPAALMQGVTVSDAAGETDFVDGGFTLAVSGSGGAIGLLAGTDFIVVGSEVRQSSTGNALGTIAGLGTLSVSVTGLTADATGATLDALLRAFGFDLAAGEVAQTRTVTLTFDDGGNGDFGVTPLTDSVVQSLVIPYNRISGDNGPNSLTGTPWADEILGRDGADTLNGAGGNDALRGGKGDDVYIIGDAGDRAYELVNEGNDTVRSSVTYSLAGQHIETLELTGSAAIDGTGNSLANRLVGNSGINRLAGGAGDDTYVVQNRDDRVIEKIGEGNDTVESSVSFSLAGQFVENLKLTGSAAIDGTGNSLDNVLTGNGGSNELYGMAGHDTLDGGLGADRMYGGTGDDTYIVDDAGDRAFEADGEGHDTVESAVTYSLSGQHVEDLVLTDAAAINGFGNSLDNAITGNAAANRLFGGLGNDMMTGGGGADSFWFDSPLAPDNVDAITDFEAGIDKIMLDKAVFTGLAVGALAAGAFVIGSAAQDAGDRIVYDAGTGELWFDADGIGAGAAVLFATLDPGLALQASDFGVFL